MPRHDLISFETLRATFPTADKVGDFMGFNIVDDSPHVLLEDELLCWRRTTDCREPSERRGALIGLARIANVLAQENGWEAILRGFEVKATIFTGATQIANGVVIDLGDVDGGEVA
jgi:hypothetical protein